MLLSDVCLSDVCQLRTSGVTREQRGLGRPQWLGHHFQGQKVKGQGHQAALRSAALTRKATVAVSVGTYSAWESTATLRLLGGARGAWAQGGGEGRGILCRHAHSLFKLQKSLIANIFFWDRV